MSPLLQQRLESEWERNTSAILTTNLNNLTWCVVLLRSLSKSGYKITLFVLLVGFFCLVGWFCCLFLVVKIRSLSKKRLKFSTIQYLSRILVKRTLNIFGCQNLFNRKNSQLYSVLEWCNFFLSFKCTKHQSLAYCGLDWLASEHPFWVHVLYFKKQPNPPPCCLTFCTEYNVHEKGPEWRLKAKRPQGPEQLQGRAPSLPEGTGLGERERQGGHSSLLLPFLSDSAHLWQLWGWVWRQTLPLGVWDVNP